MRFHFGAVPTLPDFAPDADWKSLREPAAWMVQFIAFPIGCITAGITALLWLATTPLGDPASTASAIASAFVAVPWLARASFGEVLLAMKPGSLLLWLASLVVVHELIHAAVHPMAGRS